MKKSDFSTIIGAFVMLFTFIIAVAILQSFVNDLTSRAIADFKEIVNTYEKRSLVILDITNNQTSGIAPQIDVKNIGKISENPDCMQIYVDGELVSYSYSLNDFYPDGLLNPGENVTFLIQQSLSPSWHEIYVLSCEGSKFETLVYIT